MERQCQTQFFLTYTFFKIHLDLNFLIEEIKKKTRLNKMIQVNTIVTALVVLGEHF